MQTQKFKAQPPNAFFTTVNQLFGCSSLLPNTAEQAVIKSLSNYDGMTCKVIHEGQLSRKFQVQNGVQQGCLLCSFLFLLVTDWVIKNDNEGERESTRVHGHYGPR